MDTQFGSLVVYFCFLLIVFLLCIAARHRPQRMVVLQEDGIVDVNGLEVLAHVALWLLVGSLIFAGAVDVLGWATKSKSNSVSNLIHYYFNLYPWLGWIAAGLVYHLLVDRPAPPWQ